MTKPRVPEITPEEEAQLARIMAEGDPDDIFPTDEEIEAARRRRGRPPLESPRQQISIRLEPEVIAKFKATGPGWQRRINDILKAAKV